MNEISNEQLFVKVVEAGSFKGAAEQLDMDASIVSRRISALEKRLSVKLMNRSTKRSAPTEAGFRYYQGLKTLLEEQLALENTVQGAVNKPSGHLKVAAPHDFGTHFIGPILQSMIAEFPELSVELVLGSHYENLNSQGIDVAVRIGQLPDSSLICRRIGQVPRILVASPAYLDRFGVPGCEADLQQHQFVFYGKGQMNSEVKLGREPFVMQGRFVVNSVSAIRQLVLNGLGIHLGPVWAFAKELAGGELVAVLPELNLESYPLHAIYVSRSYVPAKIRVFIDSLIKRYADQNFIEI